MTQVRIQIKGPWKSGVVTVLLAAAGMGATHAQVAATARQALRTVRGQVVQSDGSAATQATVTLTTAGGQTREIVTDQNGDFVFALDPAGSYVLRATAPGFETSTLAVDKNAPTGPSRLQLRRTTAKAAVPAQATAPSMDFADEPSFTVAGVTDWTAVGGHGSDATLRASEDLVRDTIVRSNAAGPVALDEAQEKRLRGAIVAEPRSYTANRDLGLFYVQAGRAAQAVPFLQLASALHGHAPQDEYALALACSAVGDLTQARQHVDLALARQDVAEFHRLAGELDERAGNALAAVQQLQRAASMDASEQNYFAWGSELLLHRAIWQAAEVFADGARLFPASTRMRTGWGSALFAGARYAEAAQRLCEASDLDPANRTAYFLLGKAALASPEPLPCASSTLDRFVRMQPQDADANFYAAMLMLREGAAAIQARATSMLHTTVRTDPKYAEAWLQLGILEAAGHHTPEAIALYRRAIAADPELAEAHYRLGVALDRNGKQDEGARELQVHEQLVEAQAEAVEQQRRHVKQLLVTFKTRAAEAGAAPAVARP